MLTIISPAKTLDFNIESQTDVFSEPDYLKDSQKLIKELRKLKPADISKLMSVSDKIATLNFERFAQWNLPFTTENAKQALLVFKGEVFRGIQAETLTKEELNYSQDHLRILSGLYGVLRPLDIIQAYRLEMGIKLENPSGKNLYEFWGERLTKTINKELNKQKHKILVNLASNEYYKALKSKLIEGEIITPSFKEQKGNTYKMITVHAKKARGLMTRFIIDHKIEKPEDLKAFDYEGYCYNQDLSNKNNFVFTR